MASSGWTPVQAGSVVGDQERADYDAHISKVGRRVTPKPPKTTPGGSGNHAGPGATVGQQAGTIVGNVHVTMPGKGD